MCVFKKLVKYLHLKGYQRSFLISFSKITTDSSKQHLFANTVYLFSQDLPSITAYYTQEEDKEERKRRKKTDTVKMEENKTKRRRSCKKNHIIELRHTHIQKHIHTHSFSTHTFPLV